MRVLNRVVADGEVIIDDVLKSIDITLDGDINTGRVADLQAEIDAKQRQMLTLMSGKNGSIQAAEIQAKTMAIMEEIVNLTREKEEILQWFHLQHHNIYYKLYILAPAPCLFLLLSLKSVNKSSPNCDNNLHSL